MLAGNPLWLKWSRGKLKISRDRVPLCFSSASRERDLKWPRSHLKRLSTESNQRRFYLREGTTVALVINLKSVFILFRASVIFRAQLFLKLRSFNKVALVPLTFSRLTLPVFFFFFSCWVDRKKMFVSKHLVKVCSESSARLRLPGIQTGSANSAHAGELASVKLGSCNELVNHRARRSAYIELFPSQFSSVYVDPFCFLWCRARTSSL